MNKSSCKKRIVAITLCALMFFGLLPSGALQTSALAYYGDADTTHCYNYSECPPEEEYRKDAYFDYYAEYSYCQEYLSYYYSSEYYYSLDYCYYAELPEYPKYPPLYLGYPAQHVHLIEFFVDGCTIFVCEAFPVDLAVLREGIRAYDENHVPVSVYIYDFGGLDIYNPKPGGSPGYPQPFIILYKAVHPVSGEVFFTYRELFVTIGILPMGVTICAHCGATGITHTGNLGNVPAAESSTGVLIPGALWGLCGTCSTVTILGGGARTGTGNASQSRFPLAIRGNIQRVIFTAPVTAGATVYDLFSDLSNLQEVLNISHLDTSMTQRFGRMFARSPSIASGIHLHLDLSSFDTSNAVSMYNMFMESGIVTLNTNGWDLSGITGATARDSFVGMFRGANRLTTITGLESWIPDNANRFVRMFEGASSLAGVLDLSGWDMSSATQTYQMFWNASSLSGVLDLSGWDLSGVGRMDSMFRSATGLTGIDMSGWTTSQIVNTSRMFEDLPLVTSLDLSGFSTINVTNRLGMFRGIMTGATPLRELTLGSGWVWSNTVSGDAELQNPPSNLSYSGRWRAVGTGTPNRPLGASALAADLFNNSLAIEELADTWVWEPNLSSQLVTFNPNGGTFIGANQSPARNIWRDGTYSQVFNAGGNLFNPGLLAPTNTGYVFGGWFDSQINADGTGNTGLVLPSHNVTNEASRTLWARWVPPSSGSQGAQGGLQTQPSTPGSTPNPGSPPGPPSFASGLPPSAELYGATTPLGFPQGYVYQDARYGAYGLDGAARSVFDDVRRSDWFYSMVLQLYRQGIMNGVGYREFAPYSSITRGMVIQTIYNLEGRPCISGLNHEFTDVSEGRWYYEAVVWGINNDIIKGFGDGTFRPGDYVSREHLTLILSRFADSANRDLLSAGMYNGFTDSGYVSYYAYSSVVRMYEAGIVFGRTNGSFDPLNFATRAEFAAVFYRFLQ